MPYKITIIEDDTLLATLYADLLSGPGVEITTFQNGRRALEHLERNPPNLMILDVNLPGMSGIHLLRHARQRLRLNDLKVILATANLAAAHCNYSALADAVLEKPIRFEELVRVCGAMMLERIS